MHDYRNLINAGSLLESVNGVLQDRASVIQQQELLRGVSSYSASDAAC
jgi:hypothetical protein